MVWQFLDPTRNKSPGVPCHGTLPNNVGCGFIFLVANRTERMGFDLAAEEICIGRKGIMECSPDEMLNFSRNTELPCEPP
jgi:hypothetical protein